MSTQIKSSLFDSWVREISARRSALLSQPGDFIKQSFNAFNKEGVLNVISRELKYTPPPPRRFPMQLRETESRVLARAREDYPDGEAIRSRHEQLVALDKKLTAFLEAANHRTSPEEVADATQKREAARYLLSRLPEKALRKPSMLDVPLPADIREGEITRLREWRDRLRVELGRIKEQVERSEARGESLHKSGKLHADLDGVVCAMLDAEENLTLVHTSNYGGVAGFRQHA